MLSTYPASARAGSFDFRLQSITPTTANVKVTLHHGFGCIGPCRQETITVSVYPCPPGQSCTGNTYIYTATAPTVSNELIIDLQPGTTYTFGGEYHDYGSTGGQCEWNCSSGDVLQSVQYHVPEAPGWEIETVSSSVDTVWVDARFWDIPSGTCPANAQCRLADTRYSITPCPLVVFGSNPNSDCANGTLTYRLYVHTAPIRVALKAGTTYTFAGHMQVSGQCPAVHGWDCEAVCCNVAVAPGTMEYLATTLAVVPSTWGHVKSMYRSP
jgi:hypothetical protein